MENFNKEIRSHEKSIRAKSTEIEELKKKVCKIEAKQESLIREADDAIQISKQFEEKV